MNIYLKVKHWQLFIVFIGAMFLAQALVASSIINGALPNPIAIALPTIIFGAVFFGWLWSIASACSSVLPPELSSSAKAMKFGLIYALLYILVGGKFFLSANGQLSGYIVIMHLLAMASIFYALAFTAKQVTKLRQGQNVSFFSYSGPFFLFWFFPIGVWFIQPKVNKLLGGKNA